MDHEDRRNPRRPPTDDDWSDGGMSHSGRGDPHDDPRDHAPDEIGGWDPTPRRPAPPLWQTGRFAALLAVALVALFAAAFVLPGALDGPSTARSSPTPTTSAVAASPSSAPSVGATFVRPTPTPAPTFVSYLVEAGDNLGTIARRFETTPRSIAFWNRETYPGLDPLSEGYEPNRIEVGWRLQLIPGVVYDETDLPATPPPGSSGAPLPSGPVATPPPTTGGPATVISNGPRGTNKVALTFDMGGRLDPAVDTVRWLIDHQVRATIFPTGKQTAEQPLGRAAMELVRDHPELFVLGNHSWDHPSFNDLSAAQMRDQLQRAETTLLDVVGRTSRPYFRPPFGAWNAAVRDTVGEAGWASIVMWDVDTIDWRPTADGGPTADDIEAKVLANVEGGSIVLMHLGGWHTLEALPGIIAGLEERGLEPVTLTELLAG